MNRRQFTVLSVIAGISFGLLQRQVVAQQAPPRRFDRAVLLLEHHETKPQLSRSSSGFIIKADNELFIVAGKYMTSQFSKECLIGIPVDDTRATWVLLADLANSQTGNFWEDHPTADLSIGQIDPSKKPDIASQLERFAIPLSAVFEGHLEPGMSVDVVGIPVMLGFQAKGPINRVLHRTHVATREIAVPPSWNMSTMFLLDSPLSEGDAGAPVFKYEDDPLAVTLLGITYGSLPDRTGPKYSVITPAHYLKEMIQKRVKTGNVQAGVQTDKD